MLFAAMGTRSGVTTHDLFVHLRDLTETDQFAVEMVSTTTSTAELLRLHEIAVAFLERRRSFRRLLMLGRGRLLDYVRAEHPDRVEEFERILLRTLDGMHAGNALLEQHVFRLEQRLTALEVSPERGVTGRLPTMDFATLKKATGIIDAGESADAIEDTERLYDG